MCGLAGEICFEGHADVAAVAGMAATMADRGPDGGGAWAQGPVALAHRRLKVIDLSASGSQPMVDSRFGLTAVFNGCIYNYRELRQQLRRDGYAFFSESDTEVILKAYHRWGESFVDHLVGMFACCVVERDTGRVVLARDRLRIKPLYLAETPNRVRFASSLPAILAAGDVDTTVDTAA